MFNKPPLKRSGMFSKSKMFIEICMKACILSHKLLKLSVCGDQTFYDGAQNTRKLKHLKS